MRTWLLVAGWLAASSATAAEFTWKVEVMDLKTSEVKNFEPGDGEFKLTLPGISQSCLLEAVTTNKDSNATYEARGLTCSSAGEQHITVVSCSRYAIDGSTQKDSIMALVRKKKAGGGLRIVVSCK